MKIEICLIATRKYKSFLQPLVDSVKKYFLINHEIEITVFIDDIDFEVVGELLGNLCSRHYENEWSIYLVW